MAKLSSISFRVYIYSDFHSLVLSEKVFVLCCIWVFHQQLQTVKILKEMCCYCLVFKTHCHSFYCLWVSGDSVNLETSVSYLVIYLCPNTICFMNSGPKIKLKCAITYKKMVFFYCNNFYGTCEFNPTIVSRVVVQKTTFLLLLYLNLRQTFFHCQRRAICESHG